MTAQRSPVSGGAVRPEVRVLPHSAQAEQMVIGALLFPSACIAAVPDLRPDDFYLEPCRLVFAAMRALDARRQPVDYVTVTGELERRGDLERLPGGRGYLPALAAEVPTPTHLSHYAEIVQQLARRRDLIAAAETIAVDAYDGMGDDVGVLLRAAEGRIARVALLGRGDGERVCVSMEDAMSEYLDVLDARKERGTGGIMTGYPALDGLIGGMQRAELVLLAAKSSAGKSALAFCIAHYVALALVGHVAIFSLEMDRISVQDRLVCIEAGLDSLRVRNGALSDEEWLRAVNAAATLSRTRIRIAEEPHMTVGDMRRLCLRYHNQFGPLDLIIVDYLQLVTPAAAVDTLAGWKRDDTRAQEVDRVARDLKALAREMNAPVLALCQLNRGPDARADHRPINADLRESGGLEHVADVIAFVYRPSMYDSAADRHAVEVIVSKQRNGPTGTVNLYWEPACARFRSLTHDGRGQR